MMTAPSLAVFDLDGTLVDSLPDLAESGRAMLRHYGLPEADNNGIRAMIGDGVGKLVERLLAFAARSANAERLPPQSEAVAVFMALYQPRASKLTRPFPGARATLEQLTGAGVTCAVCTNKPEAAARDILDALQLSPFFAAVGGGDSFPWRKPDPRHLLRTIELAQGIAETSVMIGDHHNDVYAASGAGAQAIFALWGYGFLEASNPARRAQAITDIPEIILPGFGT